MGWLDRRCTELREVVAPTAVRLRGRVLDGPRVRSPFTDVDALCFGWTFSVNLEPMMTAGGYGGRGDMTDARELAPRLRVAGTFGLADGLRIAVGDRVVAIPAGFEVHFRGGATEAQPVDREWPAFIPVPAAGALYYVERLLCADDEVELVATVEPVMASHGAYRGGPRTADFIARIDLEPIKLEER